MKTTTKLMYRLTVFAALVLFGTFSVNAQRFGADAEADEAPAVRECYGFEVVQYMPGPNVPGDRAIPERATGEPDRSNAAGGFVSLGEDGYIILKFDGVVYDNPGDDLQVWETTFSGDNCGGGSSEEFADISVSKDGVTFESLGVICRDGEPLDLAGTGLDYIKYVKVTDMSEGMGFGSDKSYDLDGIVALQGCSPEPAEDPNDNCDNFAAFYSHNPNGNGSSVIYSVSFDNVNSRADFNELVNLDDFAYNGSVRTHISFDGQTNTLYAAQNNGSRILVFSYDPVSGDLNYVSDIVPNSPLPGGIVQNVYFDGLVWLGSSQTDMVYSVSSTGDVTPYAFEGLNIDGGDLVVSEGRVFSASRFQKNIYRLDFNSGVATVINDGSDTPGAVNGVALSLGGNFIMANQGKTDLYVLDPNDGSIESSYEVNADFGTLAAGDLASGCANGTGEEPRECEEYRAYYSSHDNGPSKIYEVSFADDTAQFDYLFTLDYQAHIALNTVDGFIYAVNEDTGVIEKINPNDGIVAESWTLEPGDDSDDVDSVYAITFGGGGEAGPTIYFGDIRNGEVYKVTSFSAGVATYEFVADAPLRGGDLKFLSGRLYLATQDGNKLHLIVGSGIASEDGVGDLMPRVNGMALDPVERLMTTNRGQNQVFAYNANGDLAMTYDVQGFEGNFKWGDLASGCPEVFPDPTCQVDNFENPGAEGAQMAIDNGDPDFNNGWEQYSSGQEPSWLGWSTTTSIEVQQTNRVDGNASYCGEFHFELLSRNIGDNMYQVVNTNPGATVYVSFWHKQRRFNGNFDVVDEMEVLAGDYDTFDNNGDNLSILGDVVATSGDEWVFIERSFVATSAQTVVMLRGLSGTSVSIGNLIDNVYIGCEPGETACGSDGDSNDEPNTRLIPLQDEEVDNVIIDASRVAVYPVPASSEINIKVDNSGSKVDGTYYITNMSGRTSHQGIISIVDGESAVVKENVSSLPQGVYFLVMELNGRQITKKIVKLPN